MQTLQVIFSEKTCPVAWDDMDGGARVRYCGRCRHNVYDLKGMKARDARLFVSRLEGCEVNTFYQRPDGLIQTHDVCHSAYNLSSALDLIKQALGPQRARTQQRDKVDIDRRLPKETAASLALPGEVVYSDTAAADRDKDLVD